MSTSKNDNELPVASLPASSFPSTPSSSSSTTTKSTSSSALAFTTTIPCVVRLVIIPTCCWILHGLFLYGQLTPMWTLRLSIRHLDFWVNATSSTSKVAFQAAGISSNQQHVYFEKEQSIDLRTFTYQHANEDLWAAKIHDTSSTLSSSSSEDTFFNITFFSKLASILLILFSGIWPHIKLILLQYTWFFGTSMKQRTKTFHWLGILGKWSIADILVVCIMIGIIHLNWYIDDTHTVKDGLFNTLPQIITIVRSQYTSNDICNMALKIDCSSSKNLLKQTKCTACKTFINDMYTRYDWTETTGKTIFDGIETNGSAYISLHVDGMYGIYIFCIAVTSSILLSVIVDIYNHYHSSKHQRQEHQQDGRRMENSKLQEDDAEEDGRGKVGNVVSSIEPFEIDLGYDDDDDVNYEDKDEDGKNNDKKKKKKNSNNKNTSSLLLSFNKRKMDSFRIVSWCIGTIAILIMISLAVSLPTMERQLHGTIPTLLNDILSYGGTTTTNNNFDTIQPEEEQLQRQYSLISLMETIGSTDDWKNDNDYYHRYHKDTLLMLTFGIFCIFGPLVRAVLLASIPILDHCCPFSFFICPSAVTDNIKLLIQLIGSFCAWEVFVVALVLVQMLMPSMTNTIVSHPACYSTDNTDDSCLQVEYNIVPKTFSTIIIGGILLVIISFLTNRNGKVDVDKDMTMTTTTKTKKKDCPSSDQEYQSLLTPQGGTNACNDKKKKKSRHQPLEENQQGDNDDHDSSQLEMKRN